DTYERMRALDAVSRRKPPPGRASEVAAPPGHADDGRRAAAPAKRKRRFPYRKVEDLEKDIAGQETRLRELEQQLASSELYRDGNLVKNTMKLFEETKTALKLLYEHWEEAVELN